MTKTTCVTRTFLVVSCLFSSMVSFGNAELITMTFAISNANDDTFAKKIGSTWDELLNGNLYDNAPHFASGYGMGCSFSSSIPPNPEFENGITFIRFDTSSLPSGAFITSAKLIMPTSGSGTPEQADPDGKYSFVGTYYDHGGIVPTTVAAWRLISVAESVIAPRRLNTIPRGGARVNFTIDDLSGISTSGYTGFRLSLNGEMGAPSTTAGSIVNSVGFWTYELVTGTQTQVRVSELEVTYSTTPISTTLSPTTTSSSTPTMPTMTPPTPLPSTTSSVTPTILSPSTPTTTPIPTTAPMPTLFVEPFPTALVMENVYVASDVLVENMVSANAGNTVFVNGAVQVTPTTELTVYYSGITAIIDGQGFIAGQVPVINSTSTITIAVGATLHVVLSMGAGNYSNTLVILQGAQIVGNFAEVEVTLECGKRVVAPSTPTVQHGPLFSQLIIDISPEFQEEQCAEGGLLGAGTSPDIGLVIGASVSALALATLATLGIAVYRRREKQKFQTRKLQELHERRMDSLERERDQMVRAQQAIINQDQEQGGDKDNH